MTEFLTGLMDGVTRCGCAGKRVLLAVSGGADSTALLRGMLELAPKYHIELCSGHVDHSIRGPASEQDAHWVAQLCERLGVPLESSRQDVLATASQSGEGIEEAARRVRYETLEKMASARSCSQIALAHTADDQAETILHHLLRGTGISGLRGMLPMRRLDSGMMLVRPMLRISRKQVEDYLTDLGQDYRIDSTNEDLANTRNWIRRRVLVMLEQESFPGVRDVLVRLGQQAGEIEEAFDVLCASLLEKSLADRTESLVRINSAILADQPRHLIRECFVRLWRQLGWSRQEMGFAEWDRLADLCLTGGAAVLPGNVRALRRGKLLVLERPHD